MRAVNLDKSERGGAEVGEGGGGSGGDGILTMGEKLAHEQELREQLKEQGGADVHTPYESAESQREDKERNQEVHEQNERAEGSKQVAQKSSAKQGSGQEPHPTAGQGAQKQQGPAQTRQQAVMRGKDGFEGLQKPATTAASTSKPQLSATAAAAVPQERPSAAMQPLSRERPQDAIGALNSAQDPGVYFVEQQNEGGRNDEQGDPELEAAIEECIRLLFGVRGIHRVGPGTNDVNEPVIVISVSRGFTEGSMKLIPATVHRFKTLVALPFDLLPLRREIF